MNNSESPNHYQAAPARKGQALLAAILATIPTFHGAVQKALAAEADTANAPSAYTMLHEAPREILVRLPRIKLRVAGEDMLDIWHGKLSTEIEVEVPETLGVVFLWDDPPATVGTGISMYSDYPFFYEGTKGPAAAPKWRLRKYGTGAPARNGYPFSAFFDRRRTEFKKGLRIVLAPREPGSVQKFYFTTTIIEPKEETPPTSPLLSRDDSRDSSLL